MHAQGRRSTAHPRLTPHYEGRATGSLPYRQPHYRVGPYSWTDRDGRQGGRWTDSIVGGRSFEAGRVQSAGCWPNILCYRLPSNSMVLSFLIESDKEVIGVHLPFPLGVPPPFTGHPLNPNSSSNWKGQARHKVSIRLPGFIATHPLFGSRPFIPTFAGPVAFLSHSSPRRLTYNLVRAIPSSRWMEARQWMDCRKPSRRRPESKQGPIEL